MAWLYIGRFARIRIAIGKAVSEYTSAPVATYTILIFIQGSSNILAGQSVVQY